MTADVERRMAVTIERHVDGSVAEEFLALYRESFAPLEKLAATKQAFTDEEFLDHVALPSVLKYVAWDSSARPCALGLAATDLRTLPWLNEAFFAARWPDLHATNRIYYWSALLVRPEERGGPWVEAILEASTRRTLIDGAMVAMDCCRFNADVVGVPHVVASVADRHCHLEFENFDSQHFYSYVSAGRRDETTDLRDCRVGDVVVDVDVRSWPAELDLTALESEQEVVTDADAESLRSSR
jgi:hypothetical protein